MVSSTDYEARQHAVFYTSCYLLLIRCKYLHQHPHLEDPQSVFFPQCETKFNSHLNNGKNCISVLICTFSDRNRKRKWRWWMHGSNHSLNLICSKLLHACTSNPLVTLTYGESSQKSQISCPFSIADIIKNNYLINILQ